MGAGSFDGLDYSTWNTEKPPFFIEVRGPSLLTDPHVREKGGFDPGSIRILDVRDQDFTKKPVAKKASVLSFTFTLLMPQIYPPGFRQSLS